MFNKKMIVTNIRSVILYDDSTFKTHENYDPNLSCCELIYKLDGECIVNFAGQTVMEKGNFVRYLSKGNRPKGSKYTLDIINTGKCIDIYFDTDSNNPIEMLFCELDSNSSVRNMFIKIQKLWYAKHDGYYHKCMSLMYSILAELEKKDRAYMPEKKYSVIKPAIEYIDKNFLSGNIDCTFLAASCNISYSYLKRLFIMKFNLSPVKYITKKRISYACDLLVSNMYSISEVAAITGYNNVYYFSRVFKENMQMSPSEYKKSTL